VSPAVIVIAKAPVAGRVKTRLCPPCTPAQAARLAQAALQDTLDAASRSTRATRRVIALDGTPGPWLPDGFEVIAQRGEGLAERLSAAFADVGEAAFLVGMDTPQITPDLLDTGLEAVTTGDSAFGAALDGGYWGIGLRRPDPAVFAGVPMSSDRTGAVQRAQMALLGLHPRVLVPLTDVDTFEDAQTVADEAPMTRFAAELIAVSATLAEVAA
jgi:rSAM/selenodomain-associated transferase 1